MLLNHFTVVREGDVSPVVVVPIRPGMNAIYGRNGVGKTRLLRAVEALVNRSSATSPRESLFGGIRSIDATAALVTQGGMHVSAPLPPAGGAKRFDDWTLSAAAQKPLPIITAWFQISMLFRSENGKCVLP